MKKLFFYFAGLSILLSACSIFEPEVSPEGVETEVFDLDTFSKITYGDAYEVSIVPSTQFKVTATGDQSDLADLDVRVVDEELTIEYLNSGWLSNNKRFKMELLIEVPDLEGITARGASETEVGDFNLDELTLNVNSASTMRLSAIVDELTVDLGGASTLNMYKAIGSLNAFIKDASTLNAVDEAIGEAVLEVRNASRAVVLVENSLKVDARGASTVRYRGNPDVKETTKGASRVVQD